MFQRLLSLESKAFWRSSSVGKSIGIKIFLGLFGLYMLTCAAFLGAGMHFMILKLLPDAQPIQIVNSFLLAWFLLEFVLRFILQNMPVVNAKPLLVQQIKKKTIVNFLLTKSLFSFYNLLTPALIIPFYLVQLSKGTASPLALTGWLFAILATVYCLHFLNILVQKWFANNGRHLFIFIGICLLLYGLDYYHVFSVRTLFGSFYDLVLTYPWLFIIPLAIATALYFLNFKALLANLYLDAYLKNKNQEVSTANLAWTDRFGSLAPFLKLDLKLLWRNKRSKTTIWLSFFFLLYGLIIYPQAAFSNSIMNVFVGIFITGIFCINFGQFIPAWDSSYYSMLMSQNIPLRQYIESKALLMSISIGILTILSTPYVYFGWEILILNLCCALYNLGVNVPVLLYFGSFNKKRIELDKSQMLNYQGTGAAQWLVSIPVIILPMLIWLLVSKLSSPLIASVILGVLGLIGLLLRGFLMGIIVQSFRKRKYISIAGFKEMNS